MFKMFFGIYMIMVFDPQILFNDGFYDLIDVRIPAGSLLKPRSRRRSRAARTRSAASSTCSAACSASVSRSSCAPPASRRRRTSCIPATTKQRRVVPALPDRRSAEFPDARLATGLTATRCGRRSPTCRTSFSKRTSRCASNATRRWPIRGGPGLHRGGNGIEIVYRFLEPGEISIHDDRWFTYPWGVNGGLPGARSRKFIVRIDGATEVLPSKCDRIKVGAGRPAALHHLGRRRMGRSAQARPGAGGR